MTEQIGSQNVTVAYRVPTMARQCFFSLPGLRDILNVLGFLADTVSACYVVLFNLLLLRNYL